MTEVEVQMMVVGDEIQTFIRQNEFVSMDEQNEKEVYVINTELLIKKIEQLTGASS